MTFSYQFVVPNLRPCCVSALEEKLMALPQVVQVEISALKESITVVTREAAFIEDTASQMKQVIQARGYQVKNQSLDKRLTLPHWVKGVFSLLMGIFVLCLCTFGGGLPLLVMVAVGAMSTVLTVVLSFHAYRRAFAAFKEDGKLNMDSLFVISTALALGVSIASFFFPFLPMMFEVGLMVFGCRELGLAIEKYLYHKLSEEASFVKRLPPTIEVWCEETQTWQKRPVAHIQVRQRIRVQPGQRVPLDGKPIIQPGYAIREEWINGSQVARTLTESRTLLAGVEVLEDSRPIELIVEQPLLSSYLAKMDDSIRSALATKHPDADISKHNIHHMMRQVLTYFMPVALICAILSGLLVGCLVSLLAGIMTAIGLLVCVCPCVLGLIAPVSNLSGMSQAQAHGLRFMSAEDLEEAAQVDALVFDLHGTLTRGDAMVTSSEPWEEAWLRRIYEMEYLATRCSMTSVDQVRASPSIATAVMEYVRTQYKQPILVQKQAGDLEVLHGGLKMQKKGVTWLFGDEMLLKTAGIFVPHDAKKKLFLVRNKQVLASVILSQDEVRPDATETLKQLKSQGYALYLCTGETNPQVVQTYLATMQGIPWDQVVSNCLPIQKQAFIKSLQNKGKHVAAVGNGVNDAVMLASTFGIAVLDTSDHMAQEKAKVHLKGACLKPLQYLFPIAKKTRRLIYFNLIVSLMYNLASVLLAGGVLLALGITLNPVIGAALMVFQVAILLMIVFAAHKHEITLAPLDDQPDVSTTPFHALMEEAPTRQVAPIEQPAFDRQARHVPDEPLNIMENSCDFR